MKKNEKKSEEEKKDPPLGMIDGKLNIVKENDPPFKPEIISEKK